MNSMAARAGSAHGTSSPTFAYQGASRSYRACFFCAFQSRILHVVNNEGHDAYRFCPAELLGTAHSYGPDKAGRASA